MDAIPRTRCLTSPRGGRSDALRLALLAAGPHPDYADQLMVFGRLVGSWALEMVGEAREGERTEFTGEWHFGWVLEGRGVQDVLITRPRTRSAGDRSAASIGSTLRIYDRAIAGWWVTWMCPADREFSSLIARADDAGDILLEGQWSLGLQRGSRFEWSFFDITGDSFRWQCRISRDAGRTWRVVEDMSARRVA
jgi:hypothetical protein